jgi:hypothetical protein
MVSSIHYIREPAKKTPTPKNKLKFKFPPSDIELDEFIQKGLFMMDMIRIPSEPTVEQIVNFKQDIFQLKVQTAVLKEALDAVEIQGAALLELLKSASGTTIDIRA